MPQPAQSNSSNATGIVNTFSFMMIEFVGKKKSREQVFIPGTPQKVPNEVLNLSPTRRTPSAPLTWELVRLPPVPSPLSIPCQSRVAPTVCRSLQAPYLSAADLS